MITNTSDSKEPLEGGFFPNAPKFVGVGSINVKAVNPDNETLKMYGWTIPDGSDEPKYVFDTDKDGNPSSSARVCLLVQIQDCEDKPIVNMQFWVRPDVLTSNKDGVQKAKIIDNYVRTAWATKEEIQTKNIAKFGNGREKVDNNFRFCHGGEAEILAFLQKYLGCTPYEVFDKNTNSYVKAKNPSIVNFDDWNSLCSGDVKELVENLSSKPNNRVKVIFGVQITPDNKVYQTFITDTYINNGCTPDRNTGEYPAARKAIDKYMAYQNNSNNANTFVFSAAPVKKWETTASTVADNSDVPTIPGMEEDNPDDDLPFDL